MLAQRVGLTDAIDADHVAEVTGVSGLHAGQRVLEHGRMAGLHAQGARPGQERVGGRLALEVLLVDRVAVDPCLEQVLDPGCPEDVLAVGAGGDDGPPQPGLARGLDVLDRAGVGVARRGP